MRSRLCDSVNIIPRSTTIVIIIAFINMYTPAHILFDLYLSLSLPHASQSHLQRNVLELV